MTERKLLIERLQDEMKDWETRIDELKVQAALGKMEARDDVEAVKERLRAEMAPLRRKLKELSEEGGEAADDLGAGVEKAWEDMKEAIQSALSRFRS